MAATETTTYYQIGDSVEARTFIHTGYTIKYQTLVRKNCKAKPEWKTFIYKSASLSRFGAIRGLINYKRAWSGKVFFMEILSIEKTGKEDIYYMSVDNFSD